MEEKNFKTHEELVEILRNRGIKIETPSDIDYAKRILSAHGYYNLINGYNMLFLEKSNTKPAKYKADTTMNEINALYQFDRVLRDIFFRYILKIETHIKSLISYYFSQAHGHKNYLVYTNFNSSLRDSESKISNLLAELQRQIASRSSDPSILHYLKEHGYIPLWVLNNILTLGTISKFYSLMLPKERQQIAKHFNIMDKQLENCLMYISTIRNFCAHGNRLYCFRTKNPLIDNSYHLNLNIPRNPHNEFLQGKRDLFAGLLAMKFLLSKNDYKRMSKELFRAIKTLAKELSVINIDDVTSEMGFPKNWIELNDQ